MQMTPIEVVEVVVPGLVLVWVVLWATVVYYEWDSPREHPVKLGFLLATFYMGAFILTVLMVFGFGLIFWEIFG